MDRRSLLKALAGAATAAPAAITATAAPPVTREYPLYPLTTSVNPAYVALDLLRRAHPDLRFDVESFDNAALYCDCHDITVGSVRADSLGGALDRIRKESGLTIWTDGGPGIWMVAPDGTRSLGDPLP